MAGRNVDGEWTFVRLDADHVSLRATEEVVECNSHASGVNQIEAETGAGLGGVGSQCDIVEHASCLINIRFSSPRVEQPLHGIDRLARSVEDVGMKIQVETVDAIAGAGDTDER